MADLALGIVGAAAAVDVALKACKAVTRTCSTIRHAEAQLHEMSTRLQSSCIQIGTQLDIFRQIEEHLDTERQLVQTDVFEILTAKLEYAHSRLKGLLRHQAASPATEPSSTKILLKRERVNFALQKSSLDRAIADVELWQRLSFDPLWFATMKAQTQHINTELDRAKDGSKSSGRNILGAAIAVRNPLRDIDSSHIFLSSDKLESVRTQQIPFSSATLVQVDDKWRVLESMNGSSKDMVREIAVKLRRADPSTFGLLTSLGAIHDQKRDKLSIIFRMPDRMLEPQTLRAKFMADNMQHSLSERFRLATQLARAVSSIHAFDMVHKSIRPENIILFQDSESSLGSAFLLGFEKIRRDDGDTRMSGDTNWAKNIYRHPERQGTQILERYSMQHDVYSLGVCLLEVGLWSSFVEYNQDRTAITSRTYNLTGDIFDENVRPEALKSHLLALAAEELPIKMGTKYAKVVESCLTCLDLGNDDFGDETEDVLQDEVAAVRYIEKPSVTGT